MAHTVADWFYGWMCGLGCDISDAEAVVLAEALRHNQMLQKLHLGDDDDDPLIHTTAIAIVLWLLLTLCGCGCL
jgi:hypothetical protein